MTSPLNLYVSSKGIDHGPLTLEEATEKVREGEFKPEDLSWHQGVSAWVPMKELPEWSQMNKAAIPPLIAKQNVPENKNRTSETELLKKQNKNSKKEFILNQGKTNSPQSINLQVEQKKGMSLIGKLMVTIAILVFLSTLGVVGFLIYKNWNKFIPPVVETPITKETAEPASTQKVKEEQPIEEETNSIDELDPFAPPPQN